MNKLSFVGLMGFRLVGCRTSELLISSTTWLMNC